MDTSNINPVRDRNEVRRSATGHIMGKRIISIDPKKHLLSLLSAHIYIIIYIIPGIYVCVRAYTLYRVNYTLEKKCVRLSIDVIT